MSLTSHQSLSGTRLTRCASQLSHPSQREYVRKLKVWIGAPAHPPVTESEFLDYHLDLTLYQPDYSVLDSLVLPSLPLPPPLLNVPVDSCLASSSCQPSSQTLATSTALLGLSPISPTLPPLPPFSDGVTPRACCEPPPPGHGDPVALPPSLNISSDHQAFGPTGMSQCPIWVGHFNFTMDLRAVRCSPALHLYGSC